MSLIFDYLTENIIFSDKPIKVLDGNKISVCYTLEDDNVKIWEKPVYSPFSDRTDEFKFNGKYYTAENTSAVLDIKTYGEGLKFKLSARDDLSQFGVNLPINFLGKKNGGGYENQFLVNSPFISEERNVLYVYLTNPCGNDIVVAAKGIQTYKIDYSPYIWGHYFVNLKLLVNTDKVYGMSRLQNKAEFIILPVKNAEDCLQKLSAYYNLPFLYYDASGGRVGETILIKQFGPSDSEFGNYKITARGQSSITPYYKGKAGAGVTVYGYENIDNLYKQSMQSVDLKVVAATDGNLCENQCWAAAMLRYMLLYGEKLTAIERKDYEDKVLSLLRVVTETDQSKAVERRTIFNKSVNGLPVYNIYNSTRIQEQFFGVSLLLDAYKYFQDEKYYEYAVKSGESLIDNYQKIDGRIERNNNGVKEDYTTVCCPMITFVDMALFLKDKDKKLSDKFFSAAKKIAEYLCVRGISFPTEGGVTDLAEKEMEDGSISCTALSLLYYCKHVEKSDEYILKAKKILDLHEAWVIRAPVCQMFGSSLRWWETLWEGDEDGPAICAGHAWTIWRAEADWLYYSLTGDARYKRKAYNGFMSNVSKIDKDGNSYSIYNVDEISGGGFNAAFYAKTEQERYRIAPKFAKQSDSGLSRYLFIRYAQIMKDGDSLL